MIGLLIAFTLGAVAYRLFNALVWRIANRPTKFGKDVRKGMLSSLDYDALLRLHRQAGAELERRSASQKERDLQKEKARA